MAQRQTKRQGTRSLRAFLSRKGGAGRIVTLGACAALGVTLVVCLLVRGEGATLEISRSGDDLPGVEESNKLPSAAGSELASDASGGTGSQAAEEAPSHEVAVHVDGAVHAPGLYRIEGSDLRIADAIEAAGGLAQDSDTSTINLAAPLVDGSKVYVAHLGEELPQAAEPQVPMASAGAADPTPGDSGLVNVNSADVEALKTLPGVGEATARAIIEERERSGPFESVDDLVRVSGIGEKKLQKMRDHVCV